MSRFASTEIRSCKIEQKRKVSRSDVEKWNCPKSDNLTHPKESDISLLLSLLALFFCQHSTCSHAKYHSCLTNCWNDMAAESHNKKASALRVEWNYYSYAEKFVVTSSICLHTRHIMNIREKCFPSRKRFVIILTWRLIVLRVYFVSSLIFHFTKKYLYSTIICHHQLFVISECRRDNDQELCHTAFWCFFLHTVDRMRKVRKYHVSLGTSHTLTRQVKLWKVMRSAKRKLRRQRKSAKWFVDTLIQQTFRVGFLDKTRRWWDWWNSIRACIDVDRKENVDKKTRIFHYSHPNHQITLNCTQTNFLFIHNLISK